MENYASATLNKYSYGENSFVPSWMRSIRKRQKHFACVRLIEVNQHVAAWSKTSNVKFLSMYQVERDRLMKKIAANSRPDYEFTLFPPPISVKRFEGYPYCHECAEYIQGRIKIAFDKLPGANFVPSEEERKSGCTEYVWGATHAHCQEAWDALNRAMELFATGRMTEEDVKVSYKKFVRAHTVIWKNGEWKFEGVR